MVKLSPSLAELDHFAPSNWCALSHSDTDVGSIGPALLTPSSALFQTGKSGDGWVLDSANLGNTINGSTGTHIGSCQTSDAVFGGTAWDSSSSRIYVPCDGVGIVALNVNTTAHTFTLAWEQTLGYSPGPPILAGGYIWATSQFGGTLHRINPADGTESTFAINSASRFNTPAADSGRVFVADHTPNSGVNGYEIREINFGNVSPPPPPSCFIPVTQSATASNAFHPVAPFRILDTRRTGGPIPGGTARDIQVAGFPGSNVPPGATAAVLNVTVTDTNFASYLTIYPANQPRPTTSNLNWVANQTVAGLVQTALGANGHLEAFNYGGSADLVVDVEGYFTTSGGPDGLYNPIVPTRALDTRQSPPPIGQGQTRNVQVTNITGVPATGVEAVVVNLTAVGGTYNSYLTAWPAGQAQPTASNLNWTTGAIVANRATVPVGSNGQLTLYNYGGAVDVVVDVVGYYTDATLGGSGLRFTGLTPYRVLDTRPCGVGPYNTPFGQGVTRAVQVTGTINGGTTPSGAQAVVANVTATVGTYPSYLTVWPAGAPRPATSDQNWTVGMTVPNLVLVKLGGGQIDVYNHAGGVDVVVDVAGYYS